MKEGEFRAKLGEKLFGSPWFSFREEILGVASALAREAGAVFEPEAARGLPLLRIFRPREAGSCVVECDTEREGHGNFLTLDEGVEVLRRCKAVEEAVKLIRRERFSSGLLDSGTVSIVLAILEGRP